MSRSSTYATSMEMSPGSWRGLHGAATMVKWAREFALSGDVTKAVTSAPDGLPHMQGDLEMFVADFVEKSPQPGRGLFSPPTDAERATLLSGWDLISHGKPEDAAKLVEPLGMRVVHYDDARSASHHVAMYEASGPDPLRGFGLYVHRDDASATAPHIQVPHPWDDEFTDVLGVRTYLDGSAATLAVAGASRFTSPDGMADAAHSQVSFFNAISEAHAREGQRLIQLHGFSQTKHPTYGEAVVSTGDVASEDAHTVHDALRSGGVDARLYDGGTEYELLGARHNVQGNYARLHGASFVHVETGDSLRMNPNRRTQTVQALVSSIARTANV